jgi:hypothetical protein
MKFTVVMECSIANFTISAQTAFAILRKLKNWSSQNYNTSPTSRSRSVSLAKPLEEKKSGMVG